jgi:hypothetical protein
MHSPSTCTFARPEVRAARSPTEPPPPSNRWSARLVHGAQAPDQRFPVRASVQHCRVSWHRLLTAPDSEILANVRQQAALLPANLPVVADDLEAGTIVVLGRRRMRIRSLPNGRSS